jgi:hypothetical protein
MDRRLELHEKLCQVLGSRHVYYQPPENLKMQYPCIVYERSRIDPRFADNRPYSLSKRYSVTVIDQDPDSEIPDRLAAFPLCTFDRPFTTEDLHHSVFTMYY